MQQKYVIPLSIILGAAIIGFFIYLGLAQQPVPPLSVNSLSESSDRKIATCGASSNTIVTKVIDGDTLVVAGGEHVRLLGIDADEKGAPCYDASKYRLEALVLNKQISLEKDITDVDQYGRCLRAVFLGEENIGLQLVKEGVAVARFYPPDVKYREQISLAEQSAMQNKTGCKWQGL